VHLPPPHNLQIDGAAFAGVATKKLLIVQVSMQCALCAGPPKEVQGAKSQSE